MVIDITEAVINELAKEIRKCSRWAANNRPRLVHLVLHAKKRRARKKNQARIVQEYMEEIYGQ